MNFKITLFLTSFFPRLIIILLTIVLFSVSLIQYTNLHDGKEYKNYAKAIAEFNVQNLPSDTTRLYPGYPLIINLISEPLGFSLSSILVTIIFSIASVFLFYKITNHKWLSLYFSIFTPSWLLFSSLAMSEGLFVFLSLLAIYLFSKSRFAFSFLALGFNTIVRPVGILLFLPMLLIMILEKRNRWIILSSIIIYLLFPLFWLISSQIVWGNMGQNIIKYIELDFSLPFASLISGTLSHNVSIMKKILVWGNILLGVVALIILIHKYLGKQDSFILLMTLWLGISLLFYLSLSSRWTFSCLDRFMVTCLFPIFIGLERFFPKNKWVFLIILVLSIGICLYWNHNLIAVLKARGLL
jgi:Gpi18-like mannosyltransferase